MTARTNAALLQKVADDLPDNNVGVITAALLRGVLNDMIDSGPIGSNIKLALNAKHYGAVGDGIADDTTAINNWVAAVLSSGLSGYLPAGNYKVTSQLLIDLASRATSGCKFYGDGNGASVLNLQTVASSPAMRIFTGGGLAGVAITGISGTGSLVTATFSGSTVVPIGAQVTIAGSSISGYNGSWFVTASSPGSVSWSSTQTGTPSPLGTISYSVIQANSYFTGIGIQANVAGIALEIGRPDFSDQCNRNTFDLTVQNFSTSGSAIGIQLNGLYWCRGVLNTVTGGGKAAGSIGIKIRKAAFCKLMLGAAGTQYGTKLCDDFVYGNVLLAPDMEIVDTAIWISHATVSNNTFISGTYGYDTVGVLATAGNDNVFWSPNVNASAPFFAGGANNVGVSMRSGNIDNAIQIAAPTNGATVNLSSRVRFVFLSPSTNIASVTLNLPTDPGDGQRVIVTSTKAIASVSWVAGAGDSAFDLGTHLPAGFAMEVYYYAAGATWYRTTPKPGPNISAPVTKTGNFTLAESENALIVNQGSSTTVTLPAPASYPGRVIYIKTIQAFTVVSASSNVVPRAGGAAGTAILAATAGAWAILVSDEVNWIIMAGS